MLYAKNTLLSGHFRISKKLSKQRHSGAGALLFVDTVCTLGGVPLNVDADELDIVYSGSQKCLGAPPGASPLTLCDKATAKLAARKTKVRPTVLVCRHK